MEVIKLVSMLRKRPEFKRWHEHNKDADLVHIFLMVEPGKPIMFDIGFLDKDKKIMTSFLVDKDMNSIETSESKEIFSQDPQKIKPLEEDRVKILFDQALETASKLQKDKYKQHIPMKEIVILQNLEVGQVWNITYVTQSFETLNIKVDAETGKVVEDKLHQIFSM
jgi:hypothetical protein